MDGPVTHTVNLNLTLCQVCHRAQSENLQLRKCTGCKIHVYCSRPCQLTAWKAGHKEECKGIDLPSLAPHGPEQMVLAAMRAFGIKHKNMIGLATFEALDVAHHPEAAYRYVLLIKLKLNPEPALVEKMFRVTDARVCSEAELGGRIHGIFDYLKDKVEEDRLTCDTTTHAAGVVLANSDFALLDVFPCMFSAERNRIELATGDTVHIDWKQALFAVLNNGGITNIT